VPSVEDQQKPTNDCGHNVLGGRYAGTLALSVTFGSFT
jgi:hypothetical protein